YGPGMNQAWIISVMLAHNLIVYTGLLDSTADHGYRWRGWEPKTIRARIISIVAVITRHARRLILRVDRVALWQALLRAVLGSPATSNTVLTPSVEPWHCFLLLPPCIPPTMRKPPSSTPTPKHPGRSAMPRPVNRLRTCQQPIAGLLVENPR